MKSAVCVLLLAAAVFAAYDEPHDPHKPHEPHPLVPHFSQEELLNVEYELHDVAAEKILLGKKVSMLKMQVGDYLYKLEKILEYTIPTFHQNQTSQDERLVKQKEWLKALLHNVTEEEAALAGQEKMTTHNKKAALNLENRIHDLRNKNTNQDSELKEIRAFLDLARAKLFQKLADTSDAASTHLEAVGARTQDVNNFVNMRHCWNTYTYVVVGSDGTGKKNISLPHPPFDDGVTPTVFCALQGFTTYIENGQSHPHGPVGYGPEPELDKQIAVVTSCKAFSDRVEITVFDHSLGKFNSVPEIYIQLKMCSIGPQSDDH